jgi:DNA-binding NtrC family response regulator
MLNGLSVLIAEDEMLIALDLAETIEDAGGRVIGPVGSVRDAMAALDREQPDFGLLDANLTDGDTGPVAARLAKRHIPMLFFTGMGLTDRLKRCYPDVQIVRKPCMSQKIVEFIQLAMAAASAPRL